MSHSSSPALLHEPRMLVVLAGAASVGTRTVTALERAVAPNLEALATRGRTGRLRAVAPHLPAEEASAHPTLLGVAIPESLDVATVAAESVGASLAPGEHCTLIEVLDHAGEPAPALHVARAVEVLRSLLPGHRVATVRRGNQVLLAGDRISALPVVDGLELRAAPEGWLPERPPLDDRTVVVAIAGTAILGVARLLGAASVVVDGVRAGRVDPVPGRLREAATRALLGGASTVIVESAAPLLARRGLRDEPGRERAVGEAIAKLDRELIGPLWTAATWRNAAFAVTADIARLSSGQPERGDVPLIVAAGREAVRAAAMPRTAGDGVLVPAAYSERGVRDRPIVTSPFVEPPVRDPDAPVRFTRDAETGITVPAPVE
ncbi:MAG: hypothetical protein J7513_00795 [Solirubrobacteraceae bacterium]|nr:hypothetical protein [Solirubrobacteraceae bacterium]